jgi:hypothetical protein
VPCRSDYGSSNARVYVDAVVDDFEKDVRNAPLNQRGWVFQERALARRTIHFARNQTYWECGEGIRCETLTKMRNGYEAFLGDPKFPRYGLQHKKGGNIAFYEFLFEQYSGLSFTRPEDRSFAIHGLEQRLRSALIEKGESGSGKFGIFDQYWGRCLLWQRASDVPKMTRVTSSSRGGNPAPSWSWMGYTGGIIFMRLDPHSVEWQASELTFPWKDSKDLQTTTTAPCEEQVLRGLARNFHVPEGEDTTARLGIRYEDPDQVQGRAVKCLILGSTKMAKRSARQVRNYVLVVSKKESSGRDDVYERIGAGFVHGSLIDFESPPLNVLIE